jgi:hypothetical protein
VYRTTTPRGRLTAACQVLFRADSIIPHNRLCHWDELFQCSHDRVETCGGIESSQFQPSLRSTPSAIDWVHSAKGRPGQELEQPEQAIGGSKGDKPRGGDCTVGVGSQRITGGRMVEGAVDERPCAGPRRPSKK